MGNGVRSHPLLSAAQAEQAALALAAPGVDVAFLRATQGLYFARRESWPPLSPVLRLLCGIHELEPQCARFIVRHPVYTTAPATPTCAGAIRLAGRRLLPVIPRDHGLALGTLPLIDAGRAARLPRRARPELTARLQALAEQGPASAEARDWMRLALALAAEVERAGADPASGRSDRPIAALLIGSGQELLAWATHTGSRNATRHAELNLVEDWLTRSGSRLPPGATLYATLKPCKACAGVIWDSAAEPCGLRVIFAADDVGRAARETVLDAGSMARQRAVTDAADARLRLQWQLDPGV